MSNKENQQKQQHYATLVEIKEEPTALCKVLKLENMVSGGGEAKQVISDGYVLLNGEVETRKRKKVYAGDLLTFNEQHFQIALQGQTQQYEFVEQTPDAQQVSASAPEKNLGSLNEGSTDKQAKSAGKVKKPRKPISF